MTFPDLIEPMTRVGREIRMLEDYYLEGDAVNHERVLRDGKLDWDLDVVAGPRGALLFALDLAYTADREERAFQFGPPRDATFRFRVPAYVSPITEVFHVDADGLAQVDHKVNGGIVEIRDRFSRVAVYVAAKAPGERDRIEARRQALIAAENAIGFDPGRNPTDLAVLQEMARKKQ